MAATRRIALLLATTALLTSCAEADRREFIYKPAYCLAGGLAEVSSEACLPEGLKEKTTAVASAKLKDAAAEVPSEDMRVYYTDAQRSANDRTHECLAKLHGTVPPPIKPHDEPQTFSTGHYGEDFSGQLLRDKKCNHQLRVADKRRLANRAGTSSSVIQSKSNGAERQVESGFPAKCGQLSTP